MYICESKRDGWTHNIAKSDAIEKSGGSSRRTGGAGIFINVFIDKQSRSLAHLLR